MKIHVIAIGGSVMHNLALALQTNGHTITGSDDEIYNPAKERLQAAGLLPEAFGWAEGRIHEDIDAVIVGKHARIDNPELKRAQDLGLKIYSFPSFVAEMSKEKTRLVVAGSHGKTSTTSMVMHVARYCNIDFDYLVGAQLEGFDQMVRLSDAPFIVIEGDEYLTSPLDDRPKFLHYKADLAVITGIAWDHMNVFPTYELYKYQFERFVKSSSENAVIHYFGEDKDLEDLSNKFPPSKMQAYSGFTYGNDEEGTWVNIQGQIVRVPFFGAHNMQNLEAAFRLCKEMNIGLADFCAAIQSFKGASKRLETLFESDDLVMYMDFAHAPSKVRATLNAVVEKQHDKRIVACLELHTFSSLSTAFLPQYQGTLDKADLAVVLFDPHALKMKKMAMLEIEEVRQYFGPDVQVFDDPSIMEAFLIKENAPNSCYLMMSSGPWGGMDLEMLVSRLK